LGELTPDDDVERVATRGRACWAIMLIAVAVVFQSDWIEGVGVAGVVLAGLVDAAIVSCAGVFWGVNSTRGATATTTLSPATTAALGGW
jgi:hypothetical protein